MDEPKKSCPRKRQSRRIFFERANILVTLVLLMEIQFATAVSRPRESLESRMEAVASRYCDFSSSDKIYNLTNMLQCMNELASAAVSRTRVSRSSQDYFFPGSKKNQDYSSGNYQYPPRQANDFQSYYERRPPRVYSDSASYQQQAQSGYYDGGLKYPYGGEQAYGLAGGLGSRLFDALASISQYDDLKCVSRILCEVATGVIPGSSGYRQNYDGGNSLISLLTNLETGEPSPLLSFGKSALTGYANRGNPSICYRQYPKCPRSNAELISYLNNHNGGFFRFFGNVRGPGYPGSYYRGAPRRQPAPPPGIAGPESDRTGTGELKFDGATGSLGREFMKSFFPERREYNNSDKIVFPQEPLQGAQSLNRVSKSLTNYADAGNEYQNPASFFPQGRSDPVSNLLYSLNPSMQVQSRQNSGEMTVSRKARLYLPEESTNETMSTFTFPDGQKVQINVAFSKLFSESYNKALLRRSFANDHSAQPINFDSFSMINLVELFPNDRSALDLQVVHPCDMVCHDSKGTAVQFSQTLLHSRSLSTLMTPDQPVLDLTNTVPCEIICVDRSGEKRHLSTTLNQVLRNDDEQQQPAFDVTAFQDVWQNRAFRSLSQRNRVKHTKNRKVRQEIIQSQEGPQQIQELSLESVPLVPSEDQTTNGELALHIPDTEDVDQSQKEVASGVSKDGKRSFMPGNPFGFNNNRRMSYGGRSMPFMRMPGSPYTYPSRKSNPFGLGFSPMNMGMQSRARVNPFRMMSMYPGFMSLLPSMRGRLRRIRPVPPRIICAKAACSKQPSFQRVLLLCGGRLYFIPRRKFVIAPICTVIVGKKPPGSSGGATDTSQPKPEGVTEQQQLGEHQESVGEHQGGFGEAQGGAEHPEELGEHQGPGQHQGELGEQQGSLGEHQENHGAHQQGFEEHHGPEEQQPGHEEHQEPGEHQESLPGEHPGPGDNQGGLVEHPGPGDHQGGLGEHPRPGENQGSLAEHPGAGHHQGGLVEHSGPGEHQAFTEIRSTTLSYFDRESTIVHIPQYTLPPFLDPMQEPAVGTTHKFRRPEGDDYPQQSCLEGESWNLDTHECVPIKYDAEGELDYTHLPGSPWSGVTRKPLNRLRKKKKKLVIITDKGNITYIKAA